MHELLIFFLVHFFAFTFGQQENLFSSTDLNPHPVYANELQAKKVVEIAPGTELSAELNVTSKGNGLLTLGNLTLHIFDIHDDSEMFRNQMLNVKLVDFSGDNYRDLVIYGIEDEFDEVNDMEQVGQRYMLYIYRYNTETKEFDTLFTTPEWRIEVPDQ